MSETVSFPDLSASVEFPDLAQSATFPNLDETVNFPSLDLSVTIPTFDWTARLDGGAYAMTGTDVQILFGLSMVAGSGAYAITGTALSPLRSLVMAANAGSYGITGTDIAFGSGAATGFGSGSYILTGTEASLSRQLVMASGAGAYSTTGTDLAFQRDLSVSLDAGSFAITGTNAALKVGIRAALDAGSYAVSGTAAQFTRALVVSLTPGSFAITGTAAGVIHAAKLTAAAGSYAITGTAATLTVASGVDGTYHANYVDGSNSSSYSFTGVAIGTAAANRYVVIALGAKSTGSLSSISSATFGGAAMTVLHKAEGGSGETAYWLITNAPVTTGTTGTFAVTFNQSHSRCGIGSFSARNLVSTTPTDFGGTVGGDYSDTITISNGGILFMASFAGDNVGANNTTFTGIDEYFDVDVESGRSLAAGFKEYPTGGAQAVTAVITGSSQESHIAVSLR